MKNHFENCKVGDLVTLKLRATFQGYDAGHCAKFVKDDGTEYWLTNNDSGVVSVTIEPRPIRVGCKVNMKGGYGLSPGTVIFVHEDRAWVKWDDRGQTLRALSDLEVI